MVASSRCVPGSTRRSSGRSSSRAGSFPSRCARSQATSPSCLFHIRAIGGRTGPVLHETTRIEVADEPGQRIASLSGPLDVYSAFLLAGRVLAGLPDDARKLLLDLHGLSFLDSAGISALTKLRSAGKARALDVRVYFGDDFMLHKTVVSVVRRILPSVEGSTPPAKSA